MDEREILTRFKAGTLERGRAVRLLAGLKAVPGPAPEPVLSTAPDTMAPAVSDTTVPAASGTASPVTPEAHDRVPSQVPGPVRPRAQTPVPESVPVPVPAPVSPADPSAALPQGLPQARRTDGAMADVGDRFAVVGIAGRYPLAPDLRAYWQNLREGRDTSSGAPLGRPGASPLGAGQCGHFLDGAADFDADFFGLTDRRARLIDPQERLFLETVWEALEDAGCTGTRLDALTGPGGAPRGLGVFVGVSAADYSLVAAEAWARGGREMPDSGHWSVAGRLSGLLGSSGPAQVVDTAESSALVAVHLAVGALRRGECAAAVAGGVELLLHPSRGRQGAGEGVGAVVLKPLARALSDGDHVHAVVRSTSAGTGSWTGPTGLRETRGTTARRVGDAGAVTGLAALTAAVLQLRYGVLAPARGEDTATPWPRPRDAQGHELPRTAVAEVTGATGPFDAYAVLEEFVPARRPGDGSGTGIGTSTGRSEAGRVDGAGAISEAGATCEDKGRDGAGRDELILLSAPTPGHLAATAARLADWLASDNGRSGDTTTGDERVALVDVAHALRVGREARACRIALLARDLPQLVDSLREFIRSGVAAGGAEGASGTSSVDVGVGVGGVRYADLRTGGTDPLGLGDVPETGDYLGALWRAGRVEQLTRLWLSGLDIDWAALESGPDAGPEAGRALVPLPPSAFLRRSLWLGDQEGTEEKGASG
ncbi:beta-ketoacyl synthase N-terminal-like domain-containing protein [Streptomyces sp. NPDC057496]|uniref:beta-ketoacyl synthase N-terminal-like domain-containing protein n=1 Tax=Streptomyces sp. NPDC057496 TaxID=3346149 RepID=UPI0036778064